MAKRRTRAEIREEFAKLLDVFVFLRLQQIEEARESNDAAFLESLEGNPMDKDVMLADFDAKQRWSHPDHPHHPDEPKWTASMHLQGLREGLNDMLMGVLEAIDDEPRTGATRWSRMPETYRNRTGGDLFSDGGDPLGRIKAVLKRGAVRDEEEWRLLNEVVANVGTDVRNAKQSQKADQQMYEFEKSVTK